MSLAKARANRKSSDWARKRSSDDQKRNEHITRQAPKDESDNPRRGTQLLRFNGLQEISKEHRKFHKRSPKPRPAGQRLSEGLTESPELARPRKPLPRHKIQIH